MTALSLDLPDEVIEQIARRVAEINSKDCRAGATLDRGHWRRGARAIAEYIDAPVSRVKALSSAGRIPVQKDGSALIAHTDELDEWIRSGGGKRP
jgi:hypothetical protein